MYLLQVCFTVLNVSLYIYAALELKMLAELAPSILIKRNRRKKRKRSWKHRIVAVEKDWAEDREHVVTAVLKTMICAGKCSKCESDAVL